MAADHPKKRSNAPPIATASSADQSKLKRKKFHFHTTSNNNNNNNNNNISLEWDGAKKAVVPKREQTAISRRDLLPFLHASPPGHNVLADVITLPREIFGLQNLAKVLTYEVWHTCLSESERTLLTQFLPRGVDPDEVVEELLAGDNFHFGNPFLKWGSLLCSGNFHPDNIVYHEQCFKSSKKAYYLDLRKYHNDMIENLQTWKENLASCEDPEEEIVQRIWRKGFTTSTFDNSSDGIKMVAKPRKGERLLKRNIQHGDGAKYMSYIKVSKAQHQRVKSSMKHNSNSIQPKSLNNVLGNIDALHVQPFEVYEEEERRKLHEHWLQLANRDLPAAFANWSDRQLQRLQLTKSLGQEIEIKLKSQEESSDEGEEKGNSHDVLPESMDDEDSDAVSTGVAPILTAEPPTITGESEKEQSDGSIDDQMDDGSPNGELEAFEDADRDNRDCVPHEQMHTGMENSGNADNSVLVTTENKHMQHTISPQDSSRHYKNMNAESFVHQMNQTTEKASRGVPEYPENLKNVDVSMNQDYSLASTVDTWQQVGMPPASYYHSTSLNHEFSSASELSLGHPQVEEQPDQLINLEAANEEKDAQKNMLQRRSNDASFFSLYPNNENRNEPFQSLFKSQSDLAYQHDQKQTDLEFQPAANLMIESSQFPGHIREHVHSPLPLELTQKGIGEMYNHQSIGESMYSDGGRYSIERQENLPLNAQDWGVRMPAPSQSHIISGGGGELLSQSWFPGETQARSGWSYMEGSVGPSHNSIGIGSGSSCDQSLFSVLSECNELRPGASYDLINSTGRYMQSGSYGAGIHTTANVNVLQQTAANPVNNYLSGHEVAAAAAAGGYNNKTNNIGWMNMQQHQNPGLEETTVVKPFLRSWNQ